MYTYIYNYNYNYNYSYEYLYTYIHMYMYIYTHIRRRDGRGRDDRRRGQRQPSGGVVATRRKRGTPFKYDYCILYVCDIICKYTCVCMCIYIYIYRERYIYIYIHINTYIHYIIVSRRHSLTIPQHTLTPGDTTRYDKTQHNMIRDNPMTYTTNNTV